jgi:hypothetical protein
LAAAAWAGRSTELVRFEIRGGRMTVRVNSQRRAEAVVAGRERLDALLVEFEGRGQTLDELGPDVAALRKELGLDK